MSANTLWRPRLWGGARTLNPGTDASVRVHISRLRRKLKDYYQLELGEPELLVIPTGTHQLIVLDRPIEPPPVPKEVVAPPVAVRRSYAVPILSGVICVLIVGITVLGWRFNNLRSAPERPKPNAFWKSFLVGTAPIKIILPTPVFFGFKDHPSFRLRSTSVNEFNDIAKDPEFSKLTGNLGEHSFEQSYTVTWDTLAAIDMARYLDGVGAKDRVSFNVTRDLSPLFLENSNVIAVGTHQTLQPLHDYVQAMNFSLAPAELRVTNAIPRPGEQATYEIVHKSKDREIRPSILAVLPGRAPRSQGDASAIQRHRSPCCSHLFGRRIELDRGDVEEGRLAAILRDGDLYGTGEPAASPNLPVAIHTFSSQVPANSM